MKQSVSAMRISACIVVALALALALVAGRAEAYPGDDVGSDDASCKMYPNPEFQADCLKCAATAGKHYHWHTNTCAPIKAPPPPPPATIIGSVDCNRYLMFPGREKKLAVCIACVGVYVSKSNKCEDPDPDKMTPKPQLDAGECNAAGLSAADGKACRACVTGGGGYQAGEGCWSTKNKLADTTAAIVDAAGCKGDTVASIRRKRCTACMKQGTGSFPVVGPDAGQCVVDAAKYAAKYKLPPENATTGFFMPASCTLHVTADRDHITCLDCTRRLGQVYAGGVCMKPEVAAKKARALKVKPAPAGAVPHPESWSQTVDQRKAGAAIQDKLGGGVVLRAIGGLYNGGLGSISQPIKLEPSSQYRLRVKLRGVGTSDKSSAGAEIVYGIKNGMASAGWAPSTPGGYTGSAGWKLYEEDFTADAKTNTSAGTIKLWWRLDPADAARGASFVFEDVELFATAGDSVIKNGSFDAAGIVIGIPAMPAPLDPALADELAAEIPKVGKAPPPPPPKNLVPNGDFEQTAEEKRGQFTVTVATGWDVTYVPTQYGGRAITTSAARSGKYGLDLSVKATAAIRMPVEPGKKHRLSFWTKAGSGRGSKSVAVTAAAGASKATDTISDYQVKDWTQRTLEIETGAADRWIDLTIEQGSETNGSFFIDDVELFAVN